MTRKHPSLAILLPPSEGKADGGGAPEWTAAAGEFGHALSAQRAKVVKALSKCKGGDAKLLGVRGKHLERARAANASVIGAPTLPAAARYTGVVWDHLDLRSLPAAARRRAATSVVVMSGLLGASLVDDPVPDYRLKIGASLAPLGKLSTWWRAPLSDALNEWLAGRYVIDLLPHEHRAAWVPTPTIYAGGVSITFVERSGKVAGHDAKAAKGHLARHLLVSTGHPAAALDSWTDPRFDLRLTPLTPL